MKASYNWLHEYCDFSHTPNELAELLTWLGMEVDSVEKIGANWTDVVVGKVLTCEPVPKTDHLSHCTVDVGVEESLSIVCGAPNVAVGQIVPVAIVGAVLPGDFKITKRKLRGVTSQGMICSEVELEISEEGSGIMILPDSCELGAPVEKYIGQRDYVLDIEVTMNRPDCLSHVGIAREIAAVTRLKLKMPPTDVIESDELASDFVSVDIVAPTKCPRYSARMIKDVKIEPSPNWMQQRLKAVGVRPISNIVDVTNYVMLELGHPLHAFDYHLVEDGAIIVRTAEQGEEFITLDNKKHTLETSDLLIADKNRGIALAGVMGGLNTEIHDDTKDVLLECAQFEPVGIRITSRDRMVNSESSRRFERGTDPELVPFAAKRAAFLMQQLTGGKVLKGIVDNYPRHWRSRKIDLRPTRANKILGIRIQGYKMDNYLTALGCQVEEIDSKTFSVTPPSWRHDLQREIDLIEEVARIHGYDRIGNAEVSQVPLTIDIPNERRRRMTSKFKQSLVELGLREAINYSLISHSDIDKFPIGVEPAKVLNPLSEDMAYLRPTLTLSLLSSAERNSRAGMEDIRLFEWGKCFWIEKGKIFEEYRLGGIISGHVRPASWTENNRYFEIHDLKGVLEQFAQRLSLDNIRIIYYDVIDSLKVGGKIVRGKLNTEIGWFGEVKPEIAERFGMDFPIYVFEFKGDALLASAGVVPQYKPLPRYPAAHRDLAFTVKATTDSEQLEQIIRQIGGKMLENVELFDIYSGKGIAKEMKSLAYHLSYRNATRTLSDSEVDENISRIIQTILQNVGATLRSN